MNKIFTQLLSSIHARRLPGFAIGVLLLVSMLGFNSVSAQTTEIYKDDFSADDKITAINVSKGSINVAAGVLAVTGKDGSEGYDGYAVTNNPVLFEPGFTYTIYIDASFVNSSGKLEITEAATQEEAASSNARRLLSSQADNVASATSSTISKTFSVISSQSWFIGLYAVSGGNGAGMNLDNLVITKTCIPVTATIDAKTAETPRTKCMDASSVTYFSLRGSGSAGSTLSWTAVDGQPFIYSPDPTNPTISVTGVRTVTVRLTATSSCGTDFEDVTLEVIPLPTAPTNITVPDEGERCGPGVVKLTASGADEGNYRWYTGQNEPVTDVDGTLLTKSVYSPYLKETTEFLVAIVNAETGCESSGTAVKGTINTIPKATVNVEKSGCSNLDSGVPVVFELNGNKNVADGTVKWDVLEKDDAVTDVVIEDGSTLTPKVSIKGSGNVTVRLTVSSDKGCTPATADAFLRVSPTTTATGNITSVPEKPVSGESATFSVESNIKQNDDVNTYTWFITTDGKTWTKQSEPSENFIIEAVKADLMGVKVDIRPREFEPSACYSNLVPDEEYPSDMKFSIERANITVLPVEIIYLQANKRDNSVVLEWATAQELNNKGFFVEVSADGVSYASIGFVETKNGTSAVKQVYTFTDRESGKQGTRYYRLKQIDVDGTIAYFGPKAITFGAVANRVQVYPNPFSSEINLDIEAEQEGTAIITVTNAIGKQLLQRKVSVQSGANTEKLLLDARLPQGIYFIHIQMGSLSNYFKVLKQ